MSKSDKLPSPVFFDHSKRRRSSCVSGEGTVCTVDQQCTSNCIGPPIDYSGASPAAGPGVGGAPRIGPAPGSNEIEAACSIIQAKNSPIVAIVWVLGPGGILLDGANVTVTASGPYVNGAATASGTTSMAPALDPYSTTVPTPAFGGRVGFLSYDGPLYDSSGHAIDLGTACHGTVSANGVNASF